MIASVKAVPDIWRIEITVPEQAVAAFEVALERHADTVSWFMVDAPKDDTREDTVSSEHWYLEGFCREAPDRAALNASLAVTAAAIGVGLPDVHISRVPNMDWVTENLRNFPPITAGRFFVHGSHWQDGVPMGSIPLKVDAGTAFGSGEHATTWGCLSALHDLAKSRSFRRPADIGCGSGILAIACAKTWHVPVLAVDIDPAAVRVAKINAGLNGVRDLVTTGVSNGYKNRIVPENGKYDLICANILARPLTKMAADLAANLAPNGVAILSGLLSRSENYVLAAHRMQGLTLKRRYAVNGWNTLVIGR